MQEQKNIAGSIYKYLSSGNSIPKETMLLYFFKKFLPFFSSCGKQSCDLNILQKVLRIISYSNFTKKGFNLLKCFGNEITVLIYLLYYPHFLSWATIVY